MHRYERIINANEASEKECKIKLKLYEEMLYNHIGNKLDQKVGINNETDEIKYNGDFTFEDVLDELKEVKILCVKDGV